MMPRNNAIRQNAVWVRTKIALPAGAVNHCTTERRKQDTRQTEAQAFEAEIKGRVGELENKPALGRGLDQGATMADEQSAPVI
jgi:hypothetical protein